MQQARSSTAMPRSANERDPHLETRTRARTGKQLARASPCSHAAANLANHHTPISATSFAAPTTLKPFQFSTHGTAETARLSRMRRTAIAVRSRNTRASTAMSPLTRTRSGSTRCMEPTFRPAWSRGFSAFFGTRHAQAALSSFFTLPFFSLSLSLCPFHE